MQQRITVTASTDLASLLQDGSVYQQLDNVATWSFACVNENSNSSEANYGNSTGVIILNSPNLASAAARLHVCLPTICALLFGGGGASRAGKSISGAQMSLAPAFLLGGPSDQYKQSSASLNTIHFTNLDDPEPTQYFPQQSSEFNNESKKRNGQSNQQEYGKVSVKQTANIFTSASLRSQNNLDLANKIAISQFFIEILVDLWLSQNDYIDVARNGGKYIIPTAIQLQCIKILVGHISGLDLKNIFVQQQQNMHGYN
ncbi:hypothetical protein HK100_009665, partial [Physocladia obscura]